MIHILATLYRTTEQKYPKHIKAVHFIFSGGMGAVTNIGLLFILTHYFGIYYIISGIISFTLSISVTFFLQKRLTFKDTTAHDIHKKFATFTLIAIVNLCINTLLLYFLVEKLGVYYVLAQILSSGVIAFWSYFAYKFFVFKV